MRKLIISIALAAVAAGSIPVKADNPLDKAEKEARRARDRGKEEARRARERAEAEAIRAREQAEANGIRAREQTETNAKHLKERVARDARNTLLLFTESECDRVGRKEGPEAKRKCEAEEARRTPSTNRPVYSVRFQIECWKPGHSRRWGISDVTMSSYRSKQDAVEGALWSIRQKKVCQTKWRDRTLIDGNWSWISK